MSGMNAVRSVICCLLAALIFITVPRLYTVASAETSSGRTFARADSRDVYFCEKKDLSYALFTIPYTYCVEILSADGEWYYVRYAEDAGIYRALYGYCLKDKLTVVSEPPENVYLYMPVTVIYKADANTGSLPVLNELNVTAAFYGTYYAGASAYSYVFYDGSFGYIYGANDGYPLNEIPADTPADSDEESDGPNAKVITALALCALAVAVPVLLYFAGRKRYFRPDR